MKKFVFCCISLLAGVIHNPAGMGCLLNRTAPTSSGIVNSFPKTAYIVDKGDEKGLLCLSYPLVKMTDAKLGRFAFSPDLWYNRAIS